MVDLPPRSPASCQYMPEKSPRVDQRRHGYQRPKPPQLVSFNVKEQQLYLCSSSECLSSSPSLRVSPGTLRGKLILADCIGNQVFWLPPKAHKHSQGSLGKLKALHLSAMFTLMIR